MKAKYRIRSIFALILIISVFFAIAGCSDEKSAGKKETGNTTQSRFSEVLTVSQTTSTVLETVVSTETTVTANTSETAPDFETESTAGPDDDTTETDLTTTAVIATTSEKAGTTTSPKISTSVIKSTASSYAVSTTTVTGSSSVATVTETAAEATSSAATMPSSAVEEPNTTAAESTTATAETEATEAKTETTATESTEIETEMTATAAETTETEAETTAAVIVPEYHLISQDEAKRIMAQQSGYVIVDVRTNEEYAEGHIPGAICLPNESIGDLAPRTLKDKDQLILIYCRSGNRSAQASKKLVSLGYTGVYDFGGILTWTGEIVK